ncbi:uncharacterized protein LOC117647965 [Thrips palmi]|uniref:Uncharacterized protein LOC117647965 n=1 Tax=Thrips palmi TaxID=161013 RepID=A0A6P8Z0B0_THRPL|nr:uncharacterized protein LOC117647965 [Thrips palmi]
MKLKTRGAAKTLSLALDTSTWPPKGRGRDADDGGRPRTATLDKPVVLDIALLGHLDMTTLTRRGLLNVCRKGVVGVLAATPSPKPPRRASRASSRSDASSDEQQLTPVAGRRPRGGGALVRQKKAVIEEDDEDESSWAEDEQRFGTYRVRRNNRLNRTFRVPALKRQRPPLSNLNNNELVPAAPSAMDAKPGRRRGLGLGLEDILAAREQVPEPCRTCGRPELPERLHSHPKQPGKANQGNVKGHLPLAAPQPQLRVPQPDLPVKNVVKKPVAIKYRPRRGSEGADAPVAVHSPAPKGFKAASRRASPSKGSPVAKGAFLVTHFVDADSPASPSRAARGPRIVVCYVCGREFGTASLPLHEPQCIQRWQLQNSKLPPQWQRHLPEKPAGPITVEDWNKFAWDSSKRADSVQCPNCLRRFCPDRINSHERVCFKKQHAVGGEPQSQADSIGSMGSRGGRSSPLVECYLCGKKFGTRSIGIHEPQCLKKWQQLHGEDAAAQALDKPRDAGTVDIDASAEAAWQAHLSQLIPCAHCGRKFSPDRISVHERCCKGGER